MRWVGEDAPDEPPQTVPEVGGDWEATPWLACTTCGHAETEATIIFSRMLELDDLPPGGGEPTSG